MIYYHIEILGDIMEFIIIAILIVLLVVFVYPSYHYSKATKNVYQTLMEIAKQNNYELRKVSKKPYSYILISPRYNLYITSLYIPSNSQIVINSYRTWQLFWGGSSKNKGRSYPNNRFLNELSSFLHLKLENPNDRKVVILYKKTENILMYINENELEPVTSKDLPHGLKVIEYDKLLDEFENLLK